MEGGCFVSWHHRKIAHKLSATDCIVLSALNAVGCSKEIVGSSGFLSFSSAQRPSMAQLIMHKLAAGSTRCRVPLLFKVNSLRRSKCLGGGGEGVTAVSNMPILNNNMVTGVL